MVRADGAFGAGAKKEGKREIEPSAATPGPDEQQLDEVFRTHTITGGELTNETADLPGANSDERPPGSGEKPVDGWVAGVPVVDGLADSGWVECGSGRRFRMQMVVRASEIQKDWVRSMVFAPEGETPSWL